jgi:hypothetical protein
MTPMNDDGNDIPQAARALASKCDCGCGIVSVRLFDNDDGTMAEIVFEPGEWLDFFRSLQKLSFSDDQPAAEELHRKVLKQSQRPPDTSTR